MIDYDYNQKAEDKKKCVLLPKNKV